MQFLEFFSALGYNIGKLFEVGRMHKFGVLGINKPQGVSSFDIVRAVKKHTGIKKIGHGGTLDPMAEGVLPILINEGTAFFDSLLQSPKIYETCIQLGQATDTDDKEGKVINQVPVPKFSIDEMFDKIKELTGLIEQVPPIFSALKVDGKRAYDLARKGEEVTLEARKIKVFSWSNVDYDEKNQRIYAEIHCGSGTYIRSLGRDLAKALGTVGHLIELKRLKSGGISLEQCLSLDELEKWETYLLSPDDALNFIPVIEWKGSMSHLRNGKILFDEFYEAPEKRGLYRLECEEQFVALVEFNKGKLHYKKNFVPLLNL